MHEIGNVNETIYALLRIRNAITRTVKEHDKKKSTESDRRIKMITRDLH